MATVTRVLPWRRHTQPPAMEVQEIVEQYRRFHSKLPTESITEAGLANSRALANCPPYPCRGSSSTHWPTITSSSCASCTALNFASPAKPT